MTRSTHLEDRAFSLVAGALVLAGLAVMAALILMPAVAVYAEDDGVISGQIVNGTAGTSIEAAAQVALGVYRGDSLERETQSQTDETGRFRFEGLERASDLTYQVGTAHADMLYRSEPVKLADGASEREVTLNVYDTTPNDPGLRASQVFVSLALAKDASQDLLVSEMIRLVNPSDRTFVPQTGGQAGGMSLVRFGLPAGARSLQPGWGLDPKQIVQVDRGFASLDPIPPGDSVFRFSYRVPLRATGDVLEKSLPYGADLLRVMAEEGGPKISGPGLSFEQTVEARGGKILVWASRDLAPGSRLSVQLSDTPGSGPPWAVLIDALSAPWLGSAAVWLLVGLIALAPLLAIRSYERRKFSGRGHA